MVEHSWHLCLWYFIIKYMFINKRAITINYTLKKLILLPLQEVGVIESHLKEIKDAEKRQKTPVTGDMKPLIDALPVVDWINNSKIAKRKQLSILTFINIIYFITSTLLNHF